VRALVGLVRLAQREVGLGVAEDRQQEALLPLPLAEDRLAARLAARLACPSLHRGGASSSSDERTLAQASTLHASRVLLVLKVLCVELSELLELLYSARSRSQTVRARIRRWSDEERALGLMRARGWYRDPPPIPSEEGSWGEPPSRIEATTKLWAAGASWLRWETDLVVDGNQAGSSVGVKEGELFWQRWDDQEVQSNEHREVGGTMTTPEERLLDPAPLLGAFYLELGGETLWLDRRTIRVQATARPGGQANDFGPLTERLDLLVDRERGVLLKVSTFADGTEISRIEIEEIAFDEPLSGELFRPLR
jgi:hypothetical protein